MAAAMSGKVTAVAAEDYFYIPIWGAIMKRYGIIPIRRKIHDQAMRSMEAAKDAMLQGTSILMFPEGTRTKTGELQPFKIGAFKLALNAHPTIVPMAIIGAYEAKNCNSFFVRPGKIRCRFGRQILPEEYSEKDPTELSDLVRQEILSLS